MKIIRTSLKTKTWGPDDDYHVVEAQIDPAFHPELKEDIVLVAFSPEEFEKLFTISDTTEFIDEEYNVNGTVRAWSSGHEKLVEAVIRERYGELLRKFDNLEINLLDSDRLDGFLDFCVEDKEGKVGANQRAISWWKDHRDN